MVIEPLTLDGLRHIVRNMRAADRDEVFATFPRYPDTIDGRAERDEHFVQLSYLAAAERGISFMACHRGEPVAVVGMVMMWDGVAAVWMVATDKWQTVALPLTRWAKKTIIPLMKDAGIHRAQCWSMSGHDVAHGWLKRLGATEECASPGYGRDGQTFHLFAWSKGRDF